MARVSSVDKERIVKIIRESLEGIENPPNQAIKRKRITDGSDSTGISNILEGIVAWIFAEDSGDKVVTAMYLGHQICSREACEMLKCRPGQLEGRITRMLESAVDNMPHRTAMDLITMSLHRDLIKRPTWRLKGCAKCKGDQVRQGGCTIKGSVWHCIQCGYENAIE